MHWQKKINPVSGRDASKTICGTKSEDSNALNLLTEFNEVPPGWKQHVLRPRKGIQHWFDGVDIDSDSDDSYTPQIEPNVDSKRDVIDRSSLQAKQAARHFRKNISAPSQTDKGLPLHPLQCHPYQPMRPLTPRTRGPVLLQHSVSIKTNTRLWKARTSTSPRRPYSLQHRATLPAQRIQEVSVRNQTAARAVLETFLEESSTTSPSSLITQPSTPSHKAASEASPATATTACSPAIMRQYSLFPVVRTPRSDRFSTGCREIQLETTMHRSAFSSSSSSFTSSSFIDGEKCKHDDLPPSTRRDGFFQNMSAKIEIPFPSPFALRYSKVFEEAQSSASSQLLKRRGRHLRSLQLGSRKVITHNSRISNK